MSELQDFIDNEEMSYQFAMLDIKNAIALYGLDIIKDALSNYYPRDLTNMVIPDTMLVQ
jgi:hypothetical protein